VKRFLITVTCSLVLTVAAIPQTKKLEPPAIGQAATNNLDPQFGQRRNQVPDPIGEKMEKDREKALNKERQESLKKDTDKLFQLATELKNGVDKSTKDILSVEVVKKCDEIEKLAKSVKEKMKGY
jgi:hypothetical protein